MKDELLVPEVARMHAEHYRVDARRKTHAQALDLAAWGAGGRLDGVIHQADHGSNYTAMVYTERIVEMGAVPSTGTLGDSFDNAMAEAANNLYKTELIRQPGPRRTVEQVELARLEWVWWWNNSRLTASSTCATPPRSRTRRTIR